MTNKTQILLIMGAMMLIAQVSMNVNSSVLDNSELSYENQAIIDATVIAQTMVREVGAKSFDQKTVTGKVLVADSLTAPNKLGKETGETYATFNDIDDYNGYTKVDSTSRLGKFDVGVRVWYTTLALRGESTNVPTFMKTVAVKVKGNPYWKDSLEVKSVIVY
jgi:hypothetical protein